MRTRLWLLMGVVAWASAACLGGQSGTEGAPDGPSVRAGSAGNAQAGESGASDDGAGNGGKHQ